VVGGKESLATVVEVLVDILLVVLTILILCVHVRLIIAVVLVLIVVVYRQSLDKRSEFFLIFERCNLPPSSICVIS
jgi:hypothetical protein